MNPLLQPFAKHMPNKAKVVVKDEFARSESVEAIKLCLRCNKKHTIGEAVLMPTSHWDGHQILDGFRVICKVCGERTAIYKRKEKTIDVWNSSYGVRIE